MASNGQSDISVEFLKAHTIFAGIPDENLEKFRSYLEIQHFKKGDDILVEGERGDCLYMISAGNVEVLKKVLSKEEIGLERIAILGPGATFGEMEFVDNQPRSATVRALQDTTVLALSGTNIYKVTKSRANLHPDHHERCCGAEPPLAYYRRLLRRFPFLYSQGLAIGQSRSMGSTSKTSMTSLSILKLLRKPLRRLTALVTLRTKYHTW